MLPPISVTHIYIYVYIYVYIYIYRAYDKSGIYLKYMNEYILPPI